MNACSMAPGRQRWPSKLDAIFSKPWDRVRHQILGIKKLDYIKASTSNLNSKRLDLPPPPMGVRYFVASKRKINLDSLSNLGLSCQQLETTKHTSNSNHSEVVGGNWAIVH
jgi:hypothetical protein